MKTTINAHLASRMARRHRAHRIADSFSASEIVMFFSLAGRHDEQVTRSKNRKFGPPWAGGRSLSCRCLRKSKNCVEQRGDWQLVALT